MSEPTQPFDLERRGMALQPDTANEYERGGVLNPAAVLHDGVTYLFYRAVATQPENYSRILIATCALLADGTISTTRLGRVALEPQAEYELWADGQGGGVEDPRITPLEGAYYMAYTAYGNVGGVVMPRIALARSTDLFVWERLGLAAIAAAAVAAPDGAEYDISGVPNKDAILFPERIGGRYCMLHRPMFPAASGIAQSIWISFSSDLLNWNDHRLLLPPRLPWESLKVGGGTPPVATPGGWLTFYHGVEGRADDDPGRKYHAGVLLLAADDPGRIIYQSPRPVLSPGTAAEQVGVVANVVFPTGIVQQPDGRLDIYYGMADEAIGLATTYPPPPGVLVPTE